MFYRRRRRMPPQHGDHDPLLRRKHDAVDLLDYALDDRRGRDDIRPHVFVVDSLQRRARVCRHTRPPY